MHTNRSVQYWVIPPEADAEFAAHMEDVLDVYSRPYDADVPILCMDEQPVQLVEEVKTPIAATREHPKRIDYEYKRAGVANVFMFAEPLAAWRQVSVRSKKTKVDWALEMGQLMGGRYADCEKVIVVCDNLNIHTRWVRFTKPSNRRVRVRWSVGLNSTTRPSTAEHCRTRIKLPHASGREWSSHWQRRGTA